MPLSASFLRNFGWPILAGLTIGGIYTVTLWPGQSPPAPAAAIVSPTSYAEAVRVAAPAVVNIYTRTNLTQRQHPLFDDPLFRHFFNNSDAPQQERMQSALGSGVIVSPDGYILTNHHVIDGADEIVILLYDGREGHATLVGTDPESDLAVLKIDLPDITSAHTGTPVPVHVGDVVLAIGNPFGVGQTVTQGIISATGRYGLGLNTYENFLQTDAAINPGNSGGALIDAYGNLIGINTAILDKTGYSVGIGFAIPVGDALKVMGDLVQYGQVVRGWLGIEARQLSSQSAQALGLDSTNGVVITGIYNKGPAHLAGIRAGDVITHINDQPVGDGRMGMNQVADTHPGEQVTVTLLRNGNPMTIGVTIGIKPPSS